MTLMLDNSFPWVYLVLAGIHMKMKLNEAVSGEQDIYIYIWLLVSAHAHNCRTLSDVKLLIGYS